MYVGVDNQLVVLCCYIDVIDGSGFCVVSGMLVGILNVYLCVFGECIYVVQVELVLMGIFVFVEGIVYVECVGGIVMLSCVQVDVLSVGIGVVQCDMCLCIDCVDLYWQVVELIQCVGIE